MLLILGLHDNQQGVIVPFKDIYHRLFEMNVESRPIWKTKTMHMQPVYYDIDFWTLAGDKEAAGSSWTDMSVRLDVLNRDLCLPSDIKMTEEAQDFVIEAIHGIFEV